MSESRDLLSAYREALKAVRRSAGPAGALLAPLQLSADVLEDLLVRQQKLERQLGEALQPWVLMGDLAREAPATLRTQAKAFEVAAASFGQAAELMNRQADLLERTLTALSVPKGLVRSVRPSGDAPHPS